MKKSSLGLLALILSLGLLNTAMSSRGVYDEEAREAERLAKTGRTSSSSSNPARNIASGLKEVVVAPTQYVGETASATADSAIVGTLEGVTSGTEKLLENSVRGAYKVATLGFDEIDEYRVEQPEAHSGEPTKIKIKIPGT